MGREFPLPLPVCESEGTIEGQLLLDASEKQACLAAGDSLISPETVEMANVLSFVAPKEVRHYPGGELRILLVDTGAKENIVPCLQTLGATVIRVPWNDPWESYLEKVDGLLLTNGPGDPDQLSELIHLRRLRHALHSGIPLLGICLGHQWLALAAGGTVYKLKYGHRSHNQPVLDLTTRRAYLTSQNHGYAVDVAGLEDDGICRSSKGSNRLSVRR